MEALIEAVIREELAERGSQEGFLCLGEGDLATLLRAQPHRDAWNHFWTVAKCERGGEAEPPGRCCPYRGGH